MVLISFVAKIGKKKALTIMREAFPEVEPTDNGKDGRSSNENVSRYSDSREERPGDEDVTVHLMMILAGTETIRRRIDSQGLKNIKVDIVNRNTEIPQKIPNLILHSLRTQTQPFKVTHS